MPEGAVIPLPPNESLAPVGPSAEFPELPPAPGEEDQEPLPPLEQELLLHGGSYLYAPEGDRLNMPSQESAHYEFLRLPEGWRKPRPLTAFAEFLGADPIHPRPGLQWPGPEGYQWEPRFVAYGAYQVFGIAYEQNNYRRMLVGHQLLADLDLRLTGTERIHVQYRPLGQRNAGGSYYQFTSPSGYVSNGATFPDRYWVEFEVASVLGGWLRDRRRPLDYHVTLGKVPFILHNQLLMNDEVLGAVINKNNIELGPLSNLNVQLFGFPDDVDAFPNSAADLYGVNAQMDYRGDFIEMTYAHLLHAHLSARNADYVAGSYTRFFGSLSVAGRAMGKFGDQAGRGSGGLFTIETNYVSKVTHGWARDAGVEEAVYYANFFGATHGWNSISGGNFNRLQSSFVLDPLVNIAINPTAANTVGAAAGVQLFRHHKDESLIPEIAYQRPGQADSYGASLRYLRKTGRRTFLELRGLKTWSNDRRYRRCGFFAGETFVF